MTGVYDTKEKKMYSNHQVLHDSRPELYPLFVQTNRFTSHRQLGYKEEFQTPIYEGFNTIGINKFEEENWEIG